MIQFPVFGNIASYFCCDYQNNYMKVPKNSEVMKNMHEVYSGMFIGRKLNKKSGSNSSQECCLHLLH